MSKGLKALKEIKDDVVAEYIDDYKGRFETIEKELKALEIIKKNNMIIPIKGSDNRCWLESQMLDAKRISQEEYDLLKEVLS